MVKQFILASSNTVLHGARLDMMLLQMAFGKVDVYVRKHMLHSPSDYSLTSRPVYGRHESDLMRPGYVKLIMGHFMPLRCIPICKKEGGKMLVKYSGFLSHAPSCKKNAAVYVLGWVICCLSFSLQFVLIHKMYNIKGSLEI